MHQEPPVRRRSRLVALFGAIAVVAAPFVGVVAPAHAAPATTEVEAPDFASEVYADPWDYSNQADQNTDAVNTPSSISGGLLHVALKGDTAVSLVNTYSGSLASGRDGAAESIDTSRYNGLSFSMNQPFSKQIGAVYWFTCREHTSACGGGFTFEVTPGSHVYDFSLTKASTLLGKVPWSRSRVVSLRLDPVVVPSGKSGSATIDWTRLHGSGGAHAAYPPGNYGSFVVTPRAEPVVDSPNPTQGADLATVQRGKPWVLTSPSAMSGVTTSNATIKGYNAAGVTATNAAPHRNDPQLHFAVKPFSASQYHWFSFSMTYDGGFSLADAPGGGKLARLIWTVSGNNTPQIGNDMVTYSGANAHETTIDLNHQNDLDENALNPKYGWAGRTIASLRFDPNEDPGANTWHMQSLHLRADPAATGSTNITFHDAAWVSGATASVQVLRAGTTTWSTIASNVAVAQGQNSVRFALGSMAAGSYTARVTITHPGAGSATASSAAPVTMKADTSRNPRGSFDVLSATTGGATAAGWAYDPDGSPITVRFYEGSTYRGSASTTGVRSDVNRAHPDAPRTTGFSTKLTLARGTHQICAYGINVGTGGNTTLSCKSVTVR